MKFLNEVCRLQFTEANKYHARTNAVYFHTSHPGLCAALRRDKRWVQVSQMMGGDHKGKAAQNINNKPGKGGKLDGIVSTGYGGHHRAVQGFKMQRALAV